MLMLVKLATLVAQTSHLYHSRAAKMQLRSCRECQQVKPPRRHVLPDLPGNNRESSGTKLIEQLAVD